MPFTPGSPAESVLLGRTEERLRIARFVESGAGGLLVTGEAGIGKSALLEDAVRTARSRGVDVLTAYASESSRGHAWSLLTDLLAVVDFAELGLNKPVRLALDGATLREPARDVLDPAAVEVGTWQVLSRLTRDGPLLIAVDDVQWADPASLRALTHAVRRLPGRAARLLLTRRDGAGRSILETELLKKGLDIVECGPLGTEELAELLAARLDTRLPVWVLAKLTEQAGGNPLYALEYALVLRERGLPAYGAPLDLAEDRAEVLGRRLTALPDDVREVLLLLALEARLTEGQLLGLAERSAVVGALAGQVVERRPGGRLRPSHPLLASAVRRLATEQDARQSHLRIASVTSEETRARHLALGRPGPDEEVAALLEESVRRLLRRGATEAATELAGLSVARSPADAARRSERVLLLAECLVAAGDAAELTALLRSERDVLAPGDQRARAALLLREGEVDTVEGLLALLDEALAEPGVGPGIRAEALSARAETMAGVAVEELATAVQLGEQALALDANAGAGLDWALAVRGQPERPGASPNVAAIRACWRGDPGLARRMLTEELARAEDAGASWRRYDTARLLVEVELRAGDVAAAEAAIATWLATSEHESMASPDVARSRARLAALRGEPATVAALVAEIVESAIESGITWALLDARTSAGLAALRDGDPATAADRLGWVWHWCRDQGVDEAGAFPVGFDLVDALLREHREDEAAEVTTRLVVLGEQLQHPWAAAAAAQSSGLLRLAAGAADEGIGRTREAVAAFDRLGLVHDAARSLHATGNACRRQRRWGAARELLSEAAHRFAAIGAGGWAELADADLARLGGRKPSGPGLTASESSAVGLAVAGHSNKEIARLTGIAVRTVEDHLSSAYAKLGVRSRAQLARKVADR